ncbi:MAG: alpha/beta hydrolase, partial [Curtobacterium sp.]
MHVILVPGFWLDASAWDDVAPVLVEAGHSVQAVTRTGDSLDEQVASLVALLDEVATADEPVVLAGHSGAGPIAYMAADRRPALVAHLLYVDTFPGPEGGCVNDELPVVDGVVPLPSWDVWEAPTVRGMDPELREEFERRAIPEPASVPSDPFRYTDPARHAIPATVITCEVPAADLAQMVA